MTLTMRMHAGMDEGHGYEHEREHEHRPEHVNVHGMGIDMSATVPAKNERVAYEYAASSEWA